MDGLLASCVIAAKFNHNAARAVKRAGKITRSEQFREMRCRDREGKQRAWYDRIRTT